MTADGALVRADHEHHPDLFWALRGGGGNLGVVTAIEFADIEGSVRLRLLDLPRADHAEIIALARREP